MGKELFVLTKCETPDHRGATGHVTDVWLFDTFDEALAAMTVKSQEKEDYGRSDFSRFVKSDFAYAYIEYEEMQPYYYDDAESSFIRFEIHKIEKTKILSYEQDS